MMALFKLIIAALALGAQGFAPKSFPRTSTVVFQSFEEYMASRGMAAAPAAPPAAVAPPAAPPAAAPPAERAPTGYYAAPSGPAVVLTQNQEKIVDAGMAYSGLMNLPDKWPREEWRAKGGKDLFKVAGWAPGWKPTKGMVGNVVHKWSI